MMEHDTALRERLAAVCNESGASIPQTIQACVDVLMAAVCQSAPDAKHAAANVDAISECMRDNIGRAYYEYHALIAMERAPRQ
jgi:hypothetical protein